MAQDTDILTYCHIGKVGGKQLKHYMRSYFGFRYRGVDHAVGKLYRPEDLRLELRFNPWIRYLGGHDVRPHIDFHELEHRLKWFSIFREPLDRLLSHYCQQISKSGTKTVGLFEWMDANPNRAFWNTYMISGGADYQTAIEIIQKKYAFVGLNERYEQSLLLFRKIFELDGFEFQDRSQASNPDNSPVAQQIEEFSDKHQKELSERLQGDIKLYEFVCGLYMNQVNRFSESSLNNELDAIYSNSKPGAKVNFNNGVALGLDHLFWRNLSRFRKLNT